MIEIEYRDWPRYRHAEFFKGLASPFVSVQAPLDVTNLQRYTKANGVSFYFALIWCCAKVVERREDFRWRLRGDRVVLVDRPTPSFTDIRPGEELFKIVNLPIEEDDMTAYARHAREASDAQNGYFPPPDKEAGDEFIYFSCMPALAFSALTQAMDTRKDSFIPSMTWGKYERTNDRLILPFVLGFNHRQADGLHAARFLRELQGFLEDLK